MTPRKSADLLGLGEPTKPFLVVDPGKRTGVLVYWPQFVRDGEFGAQFDSSLWNANTAALDELPGLLSDLAREGIGFVVCEDFKLRGGPHAGDAGMTSAQGIGMCRMACYAAGVPLYLLPPICKRAGRMALDDAGKAARERCRNEHERDVVDLCGYVLRCARLKT